MTEKQAGDFVANAVIILAIIGAFSIVVGLVTGIYFLASWFINLI